MPILWPLVVLLLFTIQEPASGQTQSQWSSKTLVVITPSNHKQITAWQEALQHDSTNFRLQRNLEREIGETEHFAAELKSAIVNHFDYTDVLFMIDSSLQRFAGKNHLVAYRSDGQKQNIAKDSIWYLVRRSVQSGAHGLVLCDQALQQIPRPFPSFYRLNRFASFVQAFFNRADYSWRPLSSLVQKMNERLHRYKDRRTRQ